MKLVVELTEEQLKYLAHLRSCQVGRENPRKPWRMPQYKVYAREWLQFVIEKACNRELDL